MKTNTNSVVHTAHFHLLNNPPILINEIIPGARNQMMSIISYEREEKRNTPSRITEKMANIAHITQILNFSLNSVLISNWMLAKHRK